jgi:hypothetical protein
MNCIQPLTINISSSISILAYWTLDNAVPALNTDQVTGDPVQLLTVFGNVATAVPAIVSNGVQWGGAAAFGNCQGIVFQQSNNIASNGSGISFAFWINMKSAVLGFIGANTALFSYYPNIGDLSSKLEWTGEPAAAGNGDININASTFPFALPLEDGWHFCVVAVSATGDVSASIDGAALTALGNGGPIVAAPAATAQWSFNIESVLTSGAGVFYLIDEAALFAGALNNTQVAYLWNGGAGRSWPLVLP